jgi:hypothetical protein
MSFLQLSGHLMARITLIGMVHVDESFSICRPLGIIVMIGLGDFSLAVRPLGLQAWSFRGG